MSCFCSNSCKTTTAASFLSLGLTRVSSVIVAPIGCPAPVAAFCACGCLRRLRLPSAPVAPIIASASEAAFCACGCAGATVDAHWELLGRACGCDSHTTLVTVWYLTRRSFSLARLIFSASSDRCRKYRCKKKMQRRSCQMRQLRRLPSLSLRVPPLHLQ